MSKTVQVGNIMAACSAADAVGSETLQLIVRPTVPPRDGQVMISAGYFGKVTGPVRDDGLLQVECSVKSTRDWIKERLQERGFERSL